MWAVLERETEDEDEARFLLLSAVPNDGEAATEDEEADGQGSRYGVMNGVVDGRDGVVDGRDGVMDGRGARKKKGDLEGKPDKNL